MKRPIESNLRSLVEYKIACVRNGKFVHSPDFEASVKYLRSNPPGQFKQLRLGRQVREGVLSALVDYASSFKSKRNIENLITAYVCVIYHMEYHGISIPKDEIPYVTYATLYLNDNEPETLYKEEGDG